MTRANPISSVKKRERRRNSRGKNFRSNRLRSGRLGPITEYRFNNPLPSVTRATPTTRRGRLLITDFCRATHENGLVTGSPGLRQNLIVPVGRPARTLKSPLPPALELKCTFHHGDTEGTEISQRHPPCIPVYSVSPILRTRKSFAFWKRFLCVLLGAHASCVRGVRNAEHAGSVRSQGRPLRSPRLCGEIRFGCGWAALCSSVVSFRDRYYSSGISSEMVR